MDDEIHERHLNIHFTPEIMAGVYANFANVSHSDYEFTITFARVDHEVEDDEVPGVVVSRVNISPQFMKELLDAMEDNYSKWRTREGGTHRGLGEAERNAHEPGSATHRTERLRRLVAAAPAQAVPFLGQRLQPAAGVDEGRLTRLIDSLLFLARAENADLSLHRIWFQAGDEVAEILSYHELEASENGVQLRGSGDVRPSLSSLRHRSPAQKLSLGCPRRRHQRSRPPG